MESKQPTPTPATPSVDDQAKALAGQHRSFIRAYVGTRLYRALQRRGVPAELCHKVTLYARN